MIRNDKPQKMKSATSNSVTKQVMWNRLISIVEEQAQALIRTAFSTSVREAGDLSAGVYDRQGRMLAQAVTGTPGHVNAMAASVAHFIRDIGYDAMFEDDVYITNDPWKGTGHLHDITVVRPSFHKGRFIGFFAATSHVVDIGGRGFSADADSVYEEGVYIPIMKLVERGEVDKPFVHLLRGNVREPDQVIGDIFALANCNGIGHQRLVEMMNEFVLDDLVEIADFILENSRLATLERIAALYKSADVKAANGAMTIDGYNTPIELNVAIEIQDSQVLCDFSGSSNVDKRGINVPLVYTQAYSCYALKCAIAPEIPNNAASLAPFVISAPENSILNAQHPAPVALRHVVGQMLPDVVYNALDQILPDTVPVEGSSTLCNFQLSVRPCSDQVENSSAAGRAEVLTFNSGGTGARPQQDGLSATAFPSGVMTMPVEATEHAGPVVIWRKELRPDSGGVGQFRGGLGQFMDVSALEGYEFDFSAMFDRVKYPARGRKGGGDGAATKLSNVDMDNNTSVAMQGKGKQFVAQGHRVMLEFPGGGGYGKAADRELGDIKRDLQRGYISERSAKQDYGLSDQAIAEIKQSIARGEGD